MDGGWVYGNTYMYRGNVDRSSFIKYYMPSYLNLIEKNLSKIEEIAKPQRNVS